MASPPIPKPTITHPQTFQINHHVPPHYKSNVNPKQIFLPLKRPKQHLKTPTPTRPIKPAKIIHETTPTTPKITTSDILHLLDTLNLPINSDIYTPLIKECTLPPNSTRALELHAHIKHSGVELTQPLTNRLLLMHVSCGHLDIARQMFDEISVRKDFNTWAIVMIAYLGNSHFDEALRFFAEMMHSNNSIMGFPSWVVSCTLKACACSMNVGLGKQVHGLLIKLGGVNDLSLNSSLINFYGKLGCADVANVVFDGLLRRNTVIWTAKMVNDCRKGRFNEVLKEFKEMRRAGVRWNSYTLSCVLRACARMEDGGVCGRLVHVDAIKLGLELDDFVQCGLIDMYGKCGIVNDAKRVFVMICDRRNAACWNALLMGYRQNGLHVEALKLLYRMEAAGMEVQKSLINEVKVACGTATFLGNRSKQM